MSPTRQSIALLCAMPALVLAVSGCRTTKPPPKHDDGLAWTQEKLPPPSNGAIYQAGREIVYAENPIAHHVGDVVVIVLNEATAAQKSATTTTSKQTNAAIPALNFLGKTTTNINSSLNDQTKFDGEGASAQSNSLTGYLTATVTKVLPNGNLFVSGEKEIGLNQGKEFIKVTGIIRPIDLASDDSIPSYRVASAQITYSGKGAVSDVNAQGWLSRFFNSPWFPF
jgi:flagellar L-ring protein FlgH